MNCILSFKSQNGLYGRCALSVQAQPVLRMPHLFIFHFLVPPSAGQGPLGVYPGCG